MFTRSNSMSVSRRSTFLSTWRRSGDTRTSGGFRPLLQCGSIRREIRYGEDAIIPPLDPDKRPGLPRL